MNAKTIPTKRRSRGVVASYFLLFAFLFVVVVGVVADVQYSRGYEAGRQRATWEQLEREGKSIRPTTSAEYDECAEKKQCVFM